MTSNGWNLRQKGSVPWELVQLHLCWSSMVTVMMSVFGNISPNVSHCQITLFLQVNIYLFIFDCFAARPCKFFHRFTPVLISELNFFYVELHSGVGVRIGFILFAFSPWEIYNFGQSWTFKRILLYHATDHIRERIIFGNFINPPLAFGFKLVLLVCIVLLVFRVIERFFARQ